MRTTLIIDDAVFQEAKFRAARERLSVSEVINGVLRDAFRPRVSESPPPEYRPLTYGDPSRALAMEPADLSSLEEQDDLAAIRR